MKHLLLSITGLFLFAIVALPAAEARIYTTPAGFCTSTRFDGEKYKQFVEDNALTKHEIAELARDPVMREAIRRKKADRWSLQIVNGQMVICGTSTYHD